MNDEYKRFAMLKLNIKTSHHFALSTHLLCQANKQKMEKKQQLKYQLGFQCD